jgi:glutathione S-transferase
MTRRLYVKESSAACRVVRWVLARKRLDCQIAEADDALESRLAERFGTAEVPLLEEEGGRVLVGARAIVFYLERHVGPPSIFPADPQKRNQAVTFAEFAESVIGPLAAAARDGEPRPLADLRGQLGHVREAIGRRALDSGACHLGDITVAAHLVSCQGVRGLDFTVDYADLVAYADRVRDACER